MSRRVSAAQARERITPALGVIDAAHDVLRDTSSTVVGNKFRVDVAERLETQHRVNRGLTYRFFGELADPPDETGAVPAVRDMLWARLRITPKEITRRFRLAARIRPRRSLTGAPMPPELPELEAAIQAGTVGEDHIRAVCRAVDELPSCVSPTDAANAERTLVQHAAKLDAGIVARLGQRIADHLNPDGHFDDHDRARRRGLRLSPQGADGMSQLSGLIDPQTRAYFEAIEAVVRPGRHRRETDPEQRDHRTPAQRCHDALKLGLEAAICSGKFGSHRGHPVTVIVTTTLAELDRAAHAVADPSIQMPAPARTGGGSRLPMRDLIRMAAKAIHYLAVFDNHTGRPPYLGRQSRIGHCRPAADLLCARPRLHSSQLSGTGLSLRSSPFAGLGRSDRCRQAVLRLRLPPRHGKPRRASHAGHQEWPTGLDRRHRSTGDQPCPPPRRTSAG
ncbi:hypothetical protein MNVI_29120 [Mycobacterium noviomagense]|uniref:DUF222 domain-containing protein n=1 Tax=Mycobacterium noviomagense TaxID=459858 RepID=A0A7I7PG37_9MYCO|nr:hypothetical protein MNVI_29120 [Mycobacterium noviomagense]